eukprot:COSAG02_NODE_3739_length_6303_cov_12.797228_4_plen_101_part_00
MSGFAKREMRNVRFRSLQVPVSSESDEDESEIFRGVAERVVNNEDNMIVQHCAAMLLRKHDMGLLDCGDHSTSEDEDMTDASQAEAVIMLGAQLAAHFRR